MRTSARLVKPDIAIVLALARTHTQAFRSIEETAADKAELVRRLPARGLAILNAEDPRVLAMARVSRAPIRTFGLSAGHDVWADEVSSEWPGRLRLRVHAGPATAQVQTNLVGRHWLNSVLAALTAAVSCGVDLGEASRALKRVQPFPGRMQPVRLPSGAILIRDEYNASPPTLGAALDTFATFHANRKILVVGPYSDAPETSRRRLRSLGRRAAMVADLVVFISKEHGRGAVKEALAAGMDPECARSFADLRSAADYLRAELRPGDLVLVKGRTTDHLSRMVFAQFGPIGCWTAVCHRRIICDFCPELRPPVNPLPAVLAPA